MRFFVGLHQPSDAAKAGPCFISVNRLAKRKSGFPVGDWIMDSGAFTMIAKNGRYLDEPEVYAAQIRRWVANGNMLAAVSQDYMCEPWMIERTGLSLAEHQRLTIERYDAIKACDLGGAYLMPVLQGYPPESYVDHIRQYGARLMPGMWVGVGSVCKRNGKPSAIASVLLAIKEARPDLRLHGFGVKTTSLASARVRDLLETADSMAWSYAARMAGENGNDVRNAVRFANYIDLMPVQEELAIGGGHGA
jgi:hypothetical protein